MYNKQRMREFQLFKSKLIKKIYHLYLSFFIEQRLEIFKLIRTLRKNLNFRNILLL